MALLFNDEYWFIWAIVLTLALWFPMRQLIWALRARRLQKKSPPPNEKASHQLKRRATVISLLISMIFAIFYTLYLFRK